MSSVFCLHAQMQAPALTAHHGVLDYTYSLPSDWEVIDSQPLIPAVKAEQAKKAPTAEERKGVECVQVSLTARHGSPASVVVAVELPYACFGQTMSDKDLPGFADGASDGLRKSFTISDVRYGTYQLGTHNFWIERASGVVIDHPEAKYTIEIACTLLKEGAVCWMTMAADAQALESFESGPVALEGAAPTALVPANAFEKKPVH
ncbi:MAG: hypothetical protein KGN79_10990 [Acidobacteriota bacterium]|nr:hypothetical protein [Acidobacteriota bacterium]